MRTIVLITPPDRPGTLAEIAEKLGESMINISNIDVVDDHIHGIVRIIAEPHDEALRLLTEAGFQAVSDDLITIRIEDVPGGLAKIASRFTEPGINIRSLRFARRDNGWATVLLSTDDDARAQELLREFLVFPNG
ncbi:MAG TPA: hypothetical protein DCG12_21070 [Planctomycetaceae bacterium]|nr:hypothetical protein [Planctomycetaceae bacterium]